MVAGAWFRTESEYLLMFWLVVQARHNGIKAAVRYLHKIQDLPDPNRLSFLDPTQG